MWPFGERFPYTDTHELNLDWILKTIKEVSTKFPELEIAINNKLNKAINTGSAGDILVNNGGGIYEWKNYADEYSDIIIEAVNEWLTDHPEATTTVQNNSLTLQKFTDILRYLTIRNQSGVISPVYLGDFILDRNHVTQTVKFFNNKFYVINAKSRELCMSDGNGNGKVRIYNLSTNSLENEIETIVGHGNSIAFDGEYFYICPIWEYELNSETQIKKIYKYNSNFVFLSELELPTFPMSVSYDGVSQTLYVFCYNGSVYKYENDSFNYYTTIYAFSYTHDNIIDTDKQYNQDFAVWNNEFYISSPYGNILHGRLEESASEITDSFLISHTDSWNRFRIGELEGMEFTDGHLYCAGHILIPNARQEYVFELPVNQRPASSTTMSNVYYSTNDVYTLTNAIQNKFYINANEVRSILQIFAIATLNECTSISIPAGNNIIEPYDIIIPNIDCMLNLAGVLQLPRMYIRGGRLNIYASNANNKLKFTIAPTESVPNPSCIYVQRSGELTISGTQTLNVEANSISEYASNFINVASYNSIINLRTAPNCLMKLFIGSYEIVSGELFQGTVPIRNMPNTFSYSGLTGICITNSTQLLFYIPLSKPIQTPTGKHWAVTGSVYLRSNNGFIDNNSSERALSSLNVTAGATTTYCLRISIKNNDESAFGNVDNNTPIYANGTITLTLVDDE